jgi:hypothetical protein
MQLPFPGEEAPVRLRIGHEIAVDCERETDLL